MVNPPVVRWQHLCAVPDARALTLWVCALRLWSVSPSCGCGTLGRYLLWSVSPSCGCGARGTSMTRVSPLWARIDERGRPAGAGCAARWGSTRSLTDGTQPPGPEAADPGGRLRAKAKNRQQLPSERRTLNGTYICCFTYTRAPTSQHSTLSEQTGSRRRPRSRRVLSSGRGGARTTPTTSPGMPHMHHVVYLLCLARTISRAPFVLAPPHTALPGRCSCALSLSHA
jgi:hypothetical protein